MESENNKNTEQELDFGSITKGLVLLGVMLLVTYLIFILASASVSDQSIWDDAYSGTSRTLGWVVPVSILLIVIPLILYFFNLQFTKLADFAAEVESGEFEKKVLAELENEDENNSNLM